MATVTYGKTMGGKFNGKVEIALDAAEKQMVKDALKDSVEAAKRQALSLFRNALGEEEARASKSDTDLAREIARLQAEQAKALDFGTIE
ncbi:MAG: hypothetical protein L6R28_01650 [Planctomycetes bacterium]|nr:hypothetical protein [Planctomycetota bacterium]